MIKISDVSNYVGRWVNVIVENKLIQARLLNVCLGNKDYFTGIKVSESPPTSTEICEMYLVEFKSGTIDYVSEIYEIAT